MEKLNLNRDIEEASNIIDNPFFYDGSDYSHHSKIFNLPTIHHRNLYQKMGSNWTKYLGVIGSFDPALNAISMGSKDITVFDINCFNVYYAYLKIAGILALTYEEYLEYFYATNLNKFCSEFYFEKLKLNLPSDILKFWEYLYCIYDSEQIQNLFYTNIEAENEVEIIIKRSVIPSNIFLEEKKFYHLKKVLTQIKFKYHICDVREVPQIIKNEKFDIIYLSCLHNFVYDNTQGCSYLEKLKEFEDLLKKGGTIQGGYVYWHQMEDDYYWYNSLLILFEREGYKIEAIKRFENRMDINDIALLKRIK